MRKQMAGDRWQVTSAKLSTWITSSHLSLLLTCHLLIACGFTPLHGQTYREANSVDLSSLIIEVAGVNATANATSVLPRRYGELLEAEIRDRVDPGAVHQAKQFTLTINFSETESSLFVNPDGTASRGDLIYDSHYTITRIADSKQVASGTIQRISSYNTAPTAEYTSYVARETARKRGMIELAQEYKLRMATLLPTLNNPEATAVEAQPDKNLPELQKQRPYETKSTGY